MTLQRILAEVASLTRDRVRLTRLLGIAGGGWVSALSVVLLAYAAVPAATALAAGGVIAGLGEPAAGAVVAIAVLGGLLLGGQALDLVEELVRAQVTSRIDGHLRSWVRRLALTPDRIAHLETAEFQDDAARAADRGIGFGQARSAGAAAAGQLRLVFRVLSAVAAAGLLAVFFPALGAGLLVVSLAVRAMIRRQWMRLAEVVDAQAAGQRRAYYLADLAFRDAGKEVRLFGLADWLTGRYRAAAVSASAPGYRVLWRVLRRQWWTAVLVGGAAVAALGVPAAATVAGQLRPDQLVVCVFAAMGIFRITAMGFEAFDIEYGMHAVRAVDRLAGRHGGARTVPRVAPPNLATPDRAPLVRFEGVTFAYPGTERPVFDGLSLVLRPTECVAVVGPNGAGKTTLVKLLAGLYRPDTGRITVDGQDLDELDPRAWRARLTVLFQDFVRYPASLRDNVALSVPDRIGDEAGAREALRRAGGDALASALPSGMDTLLWREGEGGTDLSGGQWQRVAIARALFGVDAGRQVLVLDEPTAHLDMRAEAEFYQRVVEAAAGATRVLISHRMSTVRTADRIVLLRGGRVAEEGTHEQLMALGGDYFGFFTRQAEAFTEQAG